MVRYLVKAIAPWATARERLDPGESAEYSVNNPAYMHSGFTLTELLIALVILAVIAAVGLPIYSNYATRTYRTEAQADLLTCAQAMERFAAINFSYANAADTDADGVGDANNGAIASEICSPRSQAEGRYQITVQSDVATYALRATPANAAVTGDGFLTMDEAGVRQWDCDNSGTVDADEMTWEEPASGCN